MRLTSIAHLVFWARLRAAAEQAPPPPLVISTPNGDFFVSDVVVSTLPVAGIPAFVSLLSDGDPELANIVPIIQTLTGVHFLPETGQLQDVTSILTGPAPARVTLFGHTRIGGVVSRPGQYLLRTHYMPFWKVSGPVCLVPARNGMTWLDASAGGRFQLTASASAT